MINNIFVNLLKHQSWVDELKDRNLSGFIKNEKYICVL